VGHPGPLLLSLLFFLSLLLGCTPRTTPEEDPALESNSAPDATASEESPGEGAGGQEAGDEETGDPEEAPPLIEEASSVIVYPDGALRRIYPEDYQLGPVVTAETTGPSVDAARRFLRAVAAGEIPPDLILPESRFVILETLGRQEWPGIDGFRLGEPISMTEEVVALPVVLFSGGRRGTSEVYIEYDGDMWYISEFPVFPGMFDRDDGAIQPKGLFDPRSPQL
jgi:hypothetical protein